MIHKMENNKPLYIPPTKRLKGLVVYCNKCNTNMTDICKASGRSLKFCPNGDMHVFKVYVHVPGTKNERRTKSLETRNLDEAISQAIEFKREVQNNIHQKYYNNDDKIKEESKVEKNNKPIMLMHAMARYIGWLHNEGVPAHMIKQRSDDHIKDVERAFRVLAESLKNSEHKISELTINDINNNVVGQTYSYLENKKFANRTFNKYFSYYTSFMKWYAEEYNYPIKNCFEKVQRKKLNTNPEAITKSEYKALLKQITPENGIKEYNGVKPIRSVYRPWLADGIRLGLETGRRREEIINMKWNNILESEGVQFIKVQDYKVNRIQNRITEEEKKYIYVPVTDSLRELLNELEYEKYRDTDNFILAPDIDICRNRIMSDVLRRGFSHYYDQLNTGRKLTFKSLRKTYITHLEIFMGSGNTKAITGHSDDQVIERNYIDKREIAKASQGFNVFSRETERAEELKEIRTETKSISEELNLEV